MSAASAADPGVALPDFDAVAAAARTIAGRAHRTPVLRSRTIDRLCGAQVFFKCENLQRIGAFKFRGACNAISRLTDDARRRGVLAYSSGNHAQAVALAAAMLGSRAVIVMPEDAPRVKLEATRGYGAEVVTYDRRREQREAVSRALAESRGLSLIPPFDHADVIAGQGTAAMELIEEVGPLDHLVVCVGGGGLISGCALAAGALSPGCRVTGVEPEAGDDATRSFHSGVLQRSDTAHLTIADGARTESLGRLTFPLVLRHVHDMVTVPDGALLATVRLMMERMKIVLEPTGALAAAAVLTGRLQVAGARVGVIVSGGNIDMAEIGAQVARARFAAEIEARIDAAWSA